MTTPDWRQRQGARGTPQTPRAHRHRRRLPILLLLVPLLTGLLGIHGAPPVSGDQLSDAIARQQALARQIERQKQQIAALNAQQSTLKGDISATSKQLAGINANLADVRSRVTSLTRQIRAMEERAEEVRADYMDLLGQLAHLDDELVRLAEEELQKMEQLRERRAILAERVRAAYDTDRTSLLETFLSGVSFTSLVAEVGYSLDVAEKDQELASAIEEDVQSLASLRDISAETRRQTDLLSKETAAQKRELDRNLVELEEARTHLKEVEARLKKLEEETARALTAQKSAFEKLSKNKEELAKQMAAAAAAEKQLQETINRLVREAAQRGNIPSKYNGSLRWPMDGKVTQNFGCTGFPANPPLGNCKHFHKGIDIAAPMYTPIRASGAGRVIFAGPNPYDRTPKAWIVIIAHSADLVTWYAHVDNAVRPPAVRAGQQVTAGQVIAYNGMTGRTTGPHVHWMVEFKGTFTNPRLFL
jgi:murein DD-endopeptidase MepM/ murein hydrolase activator NlpD